VNSDGTAAQTWFGDHGTSVVTDYAYPWDD
jgi:hypothetical protein